LLGHEHITRKPGVAEVKLATKLGRHVHVAEPAAEVEKAGHGRQLAADGWFT
jgi:hypothetical protein